jgi:hypothetical protein
MKRNTTNLVQHHKVSNGKNRYKQTILTYNKENPWPCMIPLDETCTSELKTLSAISKNLSCFYNQGCPLTKSNYEDS